MKLVPVFRRMLAMCPQAWYIFIRGIQLCCALLLLAFVLLLEWGGSMCGGYELYMTALSLMETGQALLLITVIFSACIEDRQS